MPQKPAHERATELVDAFEAKGRSVLKVAVEGRRIEITLKDGQTSAAEADDPFEFLDMRR